MEPLDAKTYLLKLAEELRQIIRQAEQEFPELNESVLNWKATPERWSILECLEHLNRYSRYYHSAIEICLTNDRNSIAKEGSIYLSTWIGRLSIRLVHPSNAKKQQTFKRMNPSGSSSSKTVIKEFLIHQRRLCELIEQASQTDINRIKIPLEFLKIAKMNLGDTFGFLLAHTQRHLQQALKVKQNYYSFSD